MYHTMPFTPEKNRQIYIENRTEIIERSKKYYADNKDKIQKKILCPLCYAVVSRSWLKNHQKTYKCQINRYHPIIPLGDELPGKSKAD